MAAPDRARFLLSRLSPGGACDDCIAKDLGLPTAHRASIVSLELQGTGGFVRGQGVCALCKAAKVITRHA